MKAGDWTAKAASRLREAGVESPELSARLILAEVAGISTARLFGYPEDLLEPSTEALAESLLERRTNHEPMAYLLGRKEFRNRTFRVSPAVLIPRPETEELIDLALSLAPGAGSILDAGSGSGCIAVTLAEVYSSAVVFATERSEAALETARSNDPEGRVGWIRTDWLAAVGDDRMDLIVSNPPYLTAEEMASLSPQVRNFEPREALDGGVDGCDEYRRLIPQIAASLKPGGWTVLEVGPSVAAKAARLLVEAGFAAVEVHADLAGRERFATGRLP